MLYINGFISTNATKYGIHHKFRIRFRIFGRKQNFIQKNIEAWILIILQFVISISMNSSQRALQTNEIFFLTFKLIFEILTENQIFCQKLKNIQKE